MIAVQMFTGLGLIAASMLAVVLYVIVPMYEERKRRRNQRHCTYSAEEVSALFPKLPPE